METINVGTGVGVGDGDPLRAAMTKINANFEELDQVKQNKVESDFDITGTEPDIAIAAITAATIGYWSLTDNSTFTLSIVDGRAITLFITKGAFTLTFPSNINWVIGAEPVFEATGFNIIELFASRGVIYGSYIGNVVPASL